MKSEQNTQKAKQNNDKLLKTLYQQIVYTSECVVPLYDVIEDYLFQDLDYQRLKSVIPLWMIDAGRSPESMMDKEHYEQLRSMFNDPVSNRIIHWADMQGVLNAFQDRVMSIRSYLEVIYKYLPTYSCMRTANMKLQREDWMRHLIKYIRPSIMFLCRFVHRLIFLQK